MTDKIPRLIVFSSLYPSQARPNAGLFIRTRMSQVAKHFEMVVVSPVPWFPLQSIVQYWKPNYRPQPVKVENQHGIQVYFPRFFAMPGLGRSLDGFFMALSSMWLLSKLKKSFNFTLIDAHFGYPDGYAATLLGNYFKVPVSITLRGTEIPLSKIPGRRERLIKALQNATKIFSVSDSLKQHAISLGIAAEKIQVVGNGVDTEVFFPVDKAESRHQLQIAAETKVLISVGGLVERKGFHRVIEILPRLLVKHPTLLFLIVGGESPEGNIRGKLEQQVKTLNLSEHVRFLGALSAEALKTPLSAADVFVLATANEGWANVFLEAMACGLPVVSTDVGGNREVISDAALGTIVPFGDADELVHAVDAALSKQWNRSLIIEYARDNAWDNRINKLVAEFNAMILSN